MKRTTVRLDEDLMSRVRQHAAEQGITLTETIARALRQMLARTDRPMAEREREPLPTFRGRGLQPGVDLDDTAALLDLMGRGDDPG